MSFETWKEDKSLNDCPLIVYILVDEEEYRAHGGKKSFESNTKKITKLLLTQGLMLLYIT